MTDAPDMQALMALIERFDQARICCVGDVMLDRFIYGDVSRISPEAPIPVIKQTSERLMLGGAGNVARNIAALGAHCDFIAVTGDDTAGGTIGELLQENAQLHAHIITQEGRKTSEKTRFVSGGQQLLRCDDEQATDISEASIHAVIEAVTEAFTHCQLLILSDYAKGVLTDEVLTHVIAAAKAKHIPVFVDPKRSQLEAYRGADVMSPNLKEMQVFAGEAEPLEAAKKLAADYDIGCFAITRGAQGINLINREGEIVHLAAHTREVFDVSGAGDTVMATMAVAYAAGADLAQSAMLANLAAGIAVGRAGTATVYRTDLKAALHHQNQLESASKLVPADMAEAMVTSWREEGMKVGFTNGCFDLLHVGHLQSLNAAKDHCDKLVVAINSDASVKRLKGASRPLNSEMDRADLLGGLSCVDLVVIFREDTPEAMLQKLRPDVLMKGEDYKENQVVGADFVKSYGGRVALLPLKEGHSSTQLIEKSKNAS